MHWLIKYALKTIKNKVFGKQLKHWTVCKVYFWPKKLYGYNLSRDIL